MKTILVASYCFPDANNEQLGRFVLDQLIELNGEDINIVVLNVRRNKRLINKNTRKRFVNEIPVYETDIWAFALSKVPWLSEVLYFKRYKKLYKLAVEEYGVPYKLYAHFSFPTGMALQRIAKEEHIPLVVLEHQSLYFRDKLSKYIKKRLKEVVENTQFFLCVSSDLKKCIKNKTGCSDEAISVVLNTISPIYQYCENANDFTEFQFFSAGNLVPGKRFDLLIRAFSKVVQKRKNVKLRIAGEGDEHLKLIELINQNALNDRVELLGRINKDEMLIEYQRCHSFVLPSAVETYGIVYREALMVGRPVISSENGGIREGWNDMYGIILPETNEDTLCKAMCEIIDQYESYDRKEISKAAYASFSADSTIKHIKDLLIR